ncbi:hypothetical protein [Tengunoibacter tsumagoiensis]|uniref:Uncharacterized protein n=1 Tax=Tengunoibacter tsumagoiensis TaxID=2014871 RepID=A0A401ZZX1_9CHLR|nr:hypothetical protein [Tengunoibacter tsumagoiensis]GCE12331.1 hypothetical protein KTT_21900 [Tengunoibacter tsumagoiensis]
MSDHIPTLADLCSAIAEGHVAAATDGSTYHVNALEVRRYFSKRRSRSTVPFVQALVATYTEGNEWTGSTICNLGR